MGNQSFCGMSPIDSFALTLYPDRWVIWSQKYKEVNIKDPFSFKVSNCIAHNIFKNDIFHQMFFDHDEILRQSSEKSYEYWVNEYIVHYSVEDLKANKNFNQTNKLINFFEKNWDFGKYENFYYPIVKPTKMAFEQSIKYEKTNEELIKQAINIFGLPKNFQPPIVLENKENEHIEHPYIFGKQNWRELAPGHNFDVQFQRLDKQDPFQLKKHIEQKDLAYQKITDNYRVDKKMRQKIDDEVEEFYDKYISLTDEQKQQFMSNLGTVAKKVYNIDLNSIEIMDRQIHKMIQDHREMATQYKTEEEQRQDQWRWGLQKQKLAQQQRSKSEKQEAEIQKEQQQQQENTTNQQQSDNHYVQHEIVNTLEDNITKDDSTSQNNLELKNGVEKADFSDQIEVQNSSQHSPNHEVKKD